LEEKYVNNKITLTFFSWSSSGDDVIKDYNIPSSLGAHSGTMSQQNKFKLSKSPS
jgi:hypothetical protein